MKMKNLKEYTSPELSVIYKLDDILNGGSFDGEDDTFGRNEWVETEKIPLKWVDPNLYNM